MLLIQLSNSKYYNTSITLLASLIIHLEMPIYFWHETLEFNNGAVLLSKLIVNV